ncbi:hypothetical protein HOI71_05610, partial [Candidatus Poribacteria bacterium]|nr:hypothetical protein [Candidatus Poribacteria bacterium]
MIHKPTGPQRATRQVTVKAVVLGALFIPINSYWIMTTEIVWYSGHPTVVSLFFNAVFLLFVLALGNLGVRRVWPSAALRDDEILVVKIQVGIMHSDTLLLLHLLVGLHHFSNPVITHEIAIILTV